MLISLRICLLVAIIMSLSLSDFPLCFGRGDRCNVKPKRRNNKGSTFRLSPYLSLSLYKLLNLSPALSPSLSPLVPSMPTKNTQQSHLQLDT